MVKLRQYQQQTGITGDIGGVLMQQPINAYAGLGAAADMLHSHVEKVRQSRRNALVNRIRNAWDLGALSAQNEYENNKITINEYQERLDALKSNVYEGVDDNAVIREIQPIIDFEYGKESLRVKSFQEQEIVKAEQNELTKLIDIHRNKFISSMSTDDRMMAWAVTEGHMRRADATGAIAIPRGHTLEEYLDGMKREWWHEAFLNDVSINPQAAKNRLENGEYDLDADQYRDDKEFVDELLKRDRKESIDADLTNRLFTSLADDPKNRPTEEEISSHMEAGDLDAGTARMFLHRLEMLREVDGQMEIVTELMNDYSVIDYKNTESKKYADAQAENIIMNATAAGRSRLDIVRYLAEHAKQRNYISEPLQSIIRKGNGLSDPQLVREALYALREIRQMTGTILDYQLNANDKNNLEPLYAKWETGDITIDPMTGQDNFAEVLNETKESLRMTDTELSARGKYLENWRTSQEFIGKIDSKIRRKFGSDIPSQMYGEIQNDARRNYLYEKYDVDTAIYKAVNDVNARWRETNIGVKGYLKNPPELYYPTLDVDAANEDIRKRVDEDYPGADFKLMSHSQTDSSLLHTWQIMVDPEGDGLFTNFLVNKDGSRVLWHPDETMLVMDQAKKAEEVKNTEEAIRRFQNRREMMRKAAHENIGNNFLYGPGFVDPMEIK